MGRTARSASIIRVFAFVLAIAAPWHAEGAATAGGVALDASADCSRGDLDITLTTAGASRESWLATNAAGATLVQGEGATSLGNFDGTFPDFRIGPTGFLVAQPANTLIGSYAYVGETPPSASNTAEFFVYYNCTTREVLYSCSGAYGTCPQTAQAAAVLIPVGHPDLGTHRSGADRAYRRRGRRPGSFPTGRDLALSAVHRRGGRRARLRKLRGITLSSSAMTTAIALWLLIGGGVVAYAGWAAIAIAQGGEPWRYLAGAIAIYPVCVCAITAFWFSLAWLFRAARPRRARLGAGATARLFWNEALAIARFPRMALYKWLVREPRPRLRGRPGPAAARRAVQRRRLVRLPQAPRRARARAAVHDLVRAAAGIDRDLRGPGREEDRLHPPRDRRAPRRDRRPQHGRPRRARLPAALGAQNVSSLITFGAPHHGSVHAWLFPGACLEQLRPGNEWLAELNRAEDASRPCRRSRSGHGTTRWSRRRPAAVCAAPGMSS